MELLTWLNCCVDSCQEATVRLSACKVRHRYIYIYLCNQKLNMTLLSTC